MVDIKDISGNIRFSTPINKGSKRKFLLMKEDYITLKFSLDKPIYFHLGDGIDNELGIFELVDLYKPDYNAETSGYDYDLRLDAYYWKWKNKKFFYTPEVGGREAGWSLTATLETHMRIFLKNLEQLGYKFREQAFSYAADGTVDNSSKLVTYDNVNLIDALTQMAETWQCEWWITDSVINFGRCEYESVVDFDINGNVSEMTRSDSQSDYATRIYAFGSTRNIPSGYRPVDEDTVVNGIVQKRLMLPDGIPYIDAFPEMSAEEAIEEIVVFEDVYPRRVGTMSAITPYSYTDKIEEEGKEPVFKKWNAYRFRDTGITFSEKYVLPGQELRIIFQSGAMNGMGFAVTFNPYDKDKNEKPQPEQNKDGSWNYQAQVFEIVRNEDYGRPLPDDSLKPENGDKYVLYGFDTKFVSDTMLPDAEQELLETARKYIEKMKVDPSTYNCKMKPEFIYNDGDIVTYELGDKVNLINEAYFEEGRQSRIIGYECSLDIPYDHPVYIVGETAAYSRLGTIENKVDSLTYKGKAFGGAGAGGGSGTSVYVIGQNDRTLPSDRNVFSSRKSLKTFLNKTEPDTAVGHVTFENGILVRKQEIMEAATMALIEENDAIVEELAIRSDVTTLGEINNVSKEADEPSETNDLIVRLAGASEWTVNTSLFADVSQLMEKVFPFTIYFAGGGIYEKGSIRTINLTWDYDRDITSQSVNGETIAIDIRTKQYTDVGSDSTYNLSAVYDGQTYTKSTSVEFRLKKYYGASAHETLTDEEVLALNASWAVRVQSSTVFDCTGGKYPYYILPASMASGIQFWIGGLRNSDWTAEVRDITNTYGHTESYTIFRLNSIQTGVLNIEVK
ncbi:phage tail protein [Bacteroides congonensis]|uniref:phage tail protein n=2 Tax=Bacteroides congonensis TaxID=1871006 RepID=UPI0018A04DAA|nr:phage tail protein [Bacteroides congonensis]